MTIIWPSIFNPMGYIDPKNADRQVVADMADDIVKILKRWNELGIPLSMIMIQDKHKIHGTLSDTS